MGVAGFLLALHTKTTTNESRADAALERFATDPEVVRILNPSRYRAELFADKKVGNREWEKYQRETIRPVLNRLERLAAMTNTRRWRGGVFSAALVERVASNTIRDIWNDEYVNTVVDFDRTTKKDQTIYIESEMLAARMARMSKGESSLFLVRGIVRVLFWWKTRRKLIKAGVI